MGENKRSILVKVISRQKVVFEGEVRAITSANKVGVFDVLPQHANFVSVIKDFLLIHRTDRKVEKLDLKSGILRVWNNEVKVFLDIASPLSQPEIFSTYAENIV